MTNASENSIACKARSLCRALADIRVKEEHDVSIKLYNASSLDAPECNHVLKGSSDHSLIKTIAVIGAISFVMTAFCSACSLLRD